MLRLRKDTKIVRWFAALRRIVLAAALLTASTAAQTLSAGSGEHPLSGGTAVESTPSVRFTGTLGQPGPQYFPGLVFITFSIYSGQLDQQPLWSEGQYVKVDGSGKFTVLLGRAQDLPMEIFSENRARWLDYRAAGWPNHARVLLTSVPYAVKAKDAESLNGLPASSFVQWSDLGLASYASLKPDAGAQGSSAAREDLPSARKRGTQHAPEWTSTGDVQLNGNLTFPEDKYIATTGLVDQSVRVIPKLFLSAAGGPEHGGVVPSLTFRSNNPSHIFGEVAFQGNGRGDIWVMQQDFMLNHTENFTIRRRGQPVMTFWPLSTAGANVLTTLSGTRFRFERSGFYPLEWRDTSFPLPEGLWRTMVSHNCWFLDKNRAAAGDFSSHLQVMEACGDGIVRMAGIRLSGPLFSVSNLEVRAQGDLVLSAPQASIQYSPGPGGYNLFTRPIGIGAAEPLGSLQVMSAGNLQDAIFGSTTNSNHGISIRNAAQNWTLGVRADAGEAFVLRNITRGIDVLTVTVNGDVRLAPGARLITSASPTRPPAVPAPLSAAGLRHGRTAVPAVPPGETSLVEVRWEVPFVGTDYTATCSVVSDDEGATGLRLLRVRRLSVDKIAAVVTNEDPLSQRRGTLHCMAVSN